MLSSFRFFEDLVVFVEGSNSSRQVLTTLPLSTRIFSLLLALCVCANTVPMTSSHFGSTSSLRSSSLSSGTGTSSGLSASALGSLLEGGATHASDHSDHPVHGGSSHSWSHCHSWAYSDSMLQGCPSC